MTHSGIDTFGDRLRRLREAARLTQKVLAETLGVSQQSIAGWESNRTEPNMKTIERIAQIFEVSADSLIFSPETPLPGGKASEIRILQREASKMDAGQREKMLELLKDAFEDFNWDE